MRRLIRGLFKLALLGGLGYLVYRLIADDAATGHVAEPEPSTPIPRTEPATRSAPRAGTAPSDTRPRSAPSQPAPASRSHVSVGPAKVRSVGVGEIPETAKKWVEPNDDASCPPSHPVKAKIESGIFHVPGGRHYDRVTPDRCYRDAAAAEADGLRQSKQ